MLFENNMTSRSKFSISIVLVVLLTSFLYIFNFITNKSDALPTVQANKYNVEVFKTPTCGCCNGYVLFFEKNQFNVKKN